MSINISVDLDDIYDEMDSWDKKQMLDYLREDGYLSEESSGLNEGVSFLIPNDASLGQIEHLKLVSKLGGLYYRMRNEDMEIISNIIKKY
jgi:hypothetical protein